MTRQAKRAAAQCIAQSIRDLKSGKLVPANYNLPGLTRQETALVEHLSGENLGDGRASELFVVGINPPR